MMKQLACVLALMLSTSALARIVPNRYECEAGLTRFSYGPAEATGIPTLRLSLKDNTGVTNLTRSGNQIERTSTDAGVNIRFNGHGTKKYRLIVPVIQFKEFLQSTQTTALLVESSSANGQDTNAYFHLNCKASHDVY